MSSAAPLYIGSEIYRKPALVSITRSISSVTLRSSICCKCSAGWTQQLSRERAGTVDQLLEFHSRAYVRALQYANATGRVEPDVRERYQVGTLENPLFPGLFERASMTVGGSIMSAELASKGHVVFHPTGGTHHGRTDRASGFCYFNDPVFAILTFLKEGSRSVLYIDLDAHHGDGVEDAFFDDGASRRSRFMRQIAGRSVARSPVRGGRLQSAVPQGINDSEFELLMENAVLPLVDRSMLMRWFCAVAPIALRATRCRKWSCRMSRFGMPLISSDEKGCRPSFSAAAAIIPGR